MSSSLLHENFPCFPPPFSGPCPLAFLFALLVLSCLYRSTRDGPLAFKTRDKTRAGTLRPRWSSGARMLRCLRTVIFFVSAVSPSLKKYWQVTCSCYSHVTWNTQLHYFTGDVFLFKSLRKIVVTTSNIQRTSSNRPR